MCWGSFLNVVGYRVIRDGSIVRPRSHCPHCNHTLGALDLIPVVSWLLLRGKCRYCHAPISTLYPFIELLTTISMVGLCITVPTDYFFAYFIFFSALIVTIRSDLETMLISRFATFFLIPAGFVFSLLTLLPIHPADSILGTLVGYGFLYLISKLFFLITGKEGMGEGDRELLAFIGSFTGMVGCWISLLIASLIGSVIGIVYLLITKRTRNTRIPFGPFLATAAILYVLFETPISTFFFI